MSKRSDTTYFSSHVIVKYLLTVIVIFFFFLSFCGFPGLEVGDEINIGCGLWYRVLMLGAISSHHFRGKISADEPLLFLLESSEQKVLTEYVPIVKGLKTLLMLSLWLA